MRKYIALLLILVGCTQNPSKDAAWFQENDKLKVLSTIAMIHDLVEEVGGDYVHSIPLIRGELDPHSYELVKGDDEKFAAASLIFYNGLGLEHGLSLRQNLEGNPRAVAVTERLVSTQPKTILLVDGQYDPHVWMDISLWKESVGPIVEALCEKDPDHAAYFKERGDRLIEKMELADREAFDQLQAIPPAQRYLVTSHDAFNYFTRRYLASEDEEEWMTRCEAPEGLAPEAQMSVTDVMAVIAHVEKFKVPVLFPESNVSRDSLRKIVAAATEKGLTIRLCSEPLYGDSMGEAGSYLEMMRHNVAVIAEALRNEG